MKLVVTLLFDRLITGLPIRAIKICNDLLPRELERCDWKQWHGGTSDCSISFPEVGKNKHGLIMSFFLFCFADCSRVLQTLRNETGNHPKQTFWEQVPLNRACFWVACAWDYALRLQSLTHFPEGKPHWTPWTFRTDMSRIGLCM